VRTRLVLLGCLVATLSVMWLSSCSDDSVGPGGPSGPSWVAWRNPHVLPSSNYWLNAIWGTSARNVYAVGYAVGRGGTVFHYDGGRWTLMHCGGETGLNGIWGSSPEDVFAVGSGGTVLHYNGVRWRSMSTGASTELYGVWGRAANDVYAVGEAGTVLHYNGSEWRSIASGTDRTLHGVWGDDYWAFAVGDGGTVLRLTPREARPVDVHTTNHLYGIGGSSTTGLCVVGAVGTVLRYDGSNWQPVRSGTTRSLWKVCGTQDGHLIAVSTYRVLDFDGREWGFMDVEPEGWHGFVDVWGLSMGTLLLLEQQYVEGQTVWHYDGSTWSLMKLPELPSGDVPGQSLADVWGSSANAIYAVGGDSVLSYDGTKWTTTSVGMSGLQTVWGISDSEIYTAGNWVGSVCVDSTMNEEGWECSRWAPVCFSQATCFEGGSWNRLPKFENTTIRRFWGNSGDALIAVGAESWAVPETTMGTGYILHYRTILQYDRAAWSTMVEGTTRGLFYGVWGSSANDVFAVGSGGAIFHYDGSDWMEMTSGTTDTLFTVWGTSANDVFTVGSGGVILRLDGQSWAPMASGTTKAIYGVWGSSMNDVFAVGEDGTILHFDGSTWKVMPSPTENTLYAVWGAAPDDVFAVGEYGTICHYGSH
jgi:hypothetical protein